MTKLDKHPNVIEAKQVVDRAAKVVATSMIALFSALGCSLTNFCSHSWLPRLALPFLSLDMSTLTFFG